ncbi:MAG TPA: Na+/H+ antiporter NhaA [Kofleriaceae bacterium]
MPDPTLPPGAWAPAHAAVRRLLSPLQRFLQVEAASGLVLIAATAIAVIWANSPWSPSYVAIRHTELSLTLGAWRFGRPLEFWINDGLMTIFFFVVGLEIRREMYQGALRERRRAALPIAAACGGMLVPAAIYAACNLGRAGHAGWGVPMATDIAFAVGVLTLLGRRIPPGGRVLLLAIAAIDDIGAILVIAIFYSQGVALEGFLLAGTGLAAIAVLKAIGIRSPAAYVLPGVVVWMGTLAAGVHPTLAGVILGLLTPVRAWSRARDDLEPESPAARLEQALHRWVAFGIMPIFALANAGVDLGGASLRGDAGLVFAGVVAGLVVGKPTGILVACRLGSLLRVAARPTHVSRDGLVVTGMVAGIGFTMSLFIADLAFKPGPLLETAKLAIFVGSLVAAALGLAKGSRLVRSSRS